MLVKLSTEHWLGLYVLSFRPTAERLHTLDYIERLHTLDYKYISEWSKSHKSVYRFDLNLKLQYLKVNALTLSQKRNQNFIQL